MIVPFVVDKETHDGDTRIMVLMQKVMERWSFVSECKLGKQYCDIAQNAARHFLRDYKYFGKYLYQKSLFCPDEFQSTLCAVKHGDALNNNMRYTTHHLASNLRRNNPNHYAVLSKPYVVYFVRIKKF